MNNLPVICVFGTEHKPQLRSGEAPDFEERGMEVICYGHDGKLMEVLAKDRPSAIVSIGRLEDFKNLNAAPLSVRRFWVHYGSIEEAEANADKIFQCFFMSALREEKRLPLVSVFTPTYKTGDRIVRPWMSMKMQTYRNWEWILMDDSDDSGETFAMLSQLAEKDVRVRAYKESRRSGRIGDVKRSACGLARGDILVELDHDDELTQEALELVVGAFSKHPEAGFVYTDCAECFEDGSPVEYPAGWGMGYGSYRDETRGGLKYKVINAPNINPKTIRHIVAAPNHIRAWRSDVYHAIGGHKSMMHVADDYEIMVRTFLKTRMCHVPHLCYIQYRNNVEGNTHQVRNKEIQRLVRWVSSYYDEEIHRRFEELGVDDFVWRKGEYTFWNMQRIANPLVEPHCTITFDMR